MTTKIFGPEEQELLTPARRRRRPRGRRRRDRSYLFAPAMAASRTVLAATSAPGLYAAFGQTLGWAAADTAAGNRFPCTGKQILIARNTASAAVVVTIKGAPDDIFGRVQDQLLPIEPGDVAISAQLPTNGWRQADGYAWVDAPSADVKLAVLVLP